MIDLSTGLGGLGERGGRAISRSKAYVGFIDFQE